MAESCRRIAGFAGIALASFLIWSLPAAGREDAAGEKGAGERSVSLPGGESGIGFDDLQYAPGLKRVLVPGGRTGALFLIAPGPGEVSEIQGFSSKKGYSGGHGDGTTSACEGEGLVYATDRGSQSLKIVDPAAGRIIGSVALAGSPDYVRYVATTREVWVTEPGKERIEILGAADGGRVLRHAAFLPVPGGPESLAVDGGRMRAYTHTWKGTTYALDLKSRSIVSTWSNGCGGSRGIALDEKRGFVMTGCEEGKAVVLDASTGKVLSSLRAGSDVDSIGYAPSLGHLYVPGGGSADLSVLAVDAAGRLRLLGKIRTGPDAHTAAFDPQGRAVFIGLPERGQVLVVRDAYPSSLE